MVTTHFVRQVTGKRGCHGLISSFRIGLHGRRLHANGAQQAKTQYDESNQHFQQAETRLLSPCALRHASIAFDVVEHVVTHNAL